MTDDPPSTSASPKKPALQIQLIFQNNVIPFRVRPNTPARKFLDTALNMWHLDRGSVRFVYNGKRVREEDTPEQLGMENGDEVDVLIEQFGGSSS
ncbi:ubiquitin-like protein [Neolentinus lepideus HHB14362 ss-1]|uniref:Ubiquitin-like protein n=1 Tax=Neolentinus lepideus HHB14362 ss-1 TaxID=1314782 RepID=A0A165VU99_9AGAM|nr:ubiquitin-like protein [Neolentinus lepideus HHB14362 ss-1]